MLAPQQNGGDSAREQMLALAGRPVLKEFGEGVHEMRYIEKAVRATPPEDTTVEFVPVQVQQKWATLFSHIALALKDALDSPGPGQTRYIGNKCTLTLYPRN